MSAQAVIKSLNQVLADATVFYEKLHHYHWYVKGEHFFILHEKFEEYYDKWKDLVDDVAERILQLDGQPISTLAGCLEISRIKEETRKLDDKAMVQQVIADFETQLKGFRETQSEAEKAGDATTVNLLDDFADETEKTLWMLKAWSGR